LQPVWPVVRAFRLVRMAVSDKPAHSRARSGDRPEPEKTGCNYYS